MRVALSAVTAVLALSGSLAAQSYTVKQDGTGDFTDLQTALDSVPAGSTLLFFAGSGSGPDADNVVIRQSVAIIGENGPLIGGNSYGGSYYFDPGIRVDAPSDAVVVLDGLSVAPYGGAGDYLPTLGIEIDGVGTLLLDRCSVQGTGAADGDPMPVGWNPPSAVAVTGSASEVIVLNSSLIGGTGTSESNVGDWEGCAGNGTVIGGPGGHGLDALNAATVLVTDSTLIGGDGGPANYQDEFGCADNPPDVLQGGDGGDAIAGSAYVSNCTLTPGKGGTYADAKWGIGENGPDGVEVSGTRVDLPDNIAVSGPATIGASLTFSGSGFSPFRVAFIFESLEIAAPFHIRQGEWFLAPPIFLLGATTTDVSGAFSLTGSVPNDPNLVGLTLALQFADTDHLSEPVPLILRD